MSEEIAPQHLVELQDAMDQQIVALYQPGSSYLIERGVSDILVGLGVDPGDHNFSRTPQRFAKVMREVFAPPETDIPVFDEQYTDIVLLRNFEFYTFCPHHLLPVKLRASLAYKPHGKVIGASKLARLMLDANRYPMTQEFLTSRILERVEELTAKTSQGAILHMVGEHGCFRIRGIKAACTDMITLKYNGCFEQVEEQNRFLSLLRS
jgi:GTP cyclohydrolase I